MLSCKTPVPHRLLLALLWPRYVLAATDCVCTRFQQAEPTDITSSISVQSNIFTGTAFWNIPVKLAYSQIFFFKLEQRAEGYHHHRFLRINQLSIYHWYVAIMNSTNFWVICSVIRDDPSSQDHQKKKKIPSLFPGKRPSEACIPPPSPKQCPKYSWRRLVCFIKTSSNNASTTFSKANDCSTKIPLSLESFFKHLPKSCHLQIKPISSHPNPSSCTVYSLPPCRNLPHTWTLLSCLLLAFSPVD